jgi:hypothetical protein
MKTILIAALFALGVAFAGTTWASATDGTVALHKATNVDSTTLSARRRLHCRWIEVCRGPWWARTCRLERVCRRVWY